jgi:hypothetical protein
LPTRAKEEKERRREGMDAPAAKEEGGAGQVVTRAVAGGGAVEVVREGDLEKQSPGTLGKRWQTRHFTLTPTALVYAKKRKHGAPPSPPSFALCHLILFIFLHYLF